MNNKNIKSNKFNEVGTTYIYKFSNISSGILHKIPLMNPNIITTIRNIILIHMCYKIIYLKNHNNLGINVFFIGILDCIDGAYARKYNMTTDFGDKYDHISDTISTIVIFYILFKYSDTKYSLIIAVIFLFIACRQMMCMEIYNKKYLDIDNHRDSISLFQKICPVKTKKGLENFLQKHKYLGYTTYYLVLIILFSKIK